jgi:hypothetical protein
MNKPLIRFAALLAAALIAAPRPAALPPQKLLYAGDWAYDALALLAQEQGAVFFADSVITVSQAALMLAEIDGAALSPAGEGLRRSLLAYLEASPAYAYRSGALEAGVDLELNAEAFVKTEPAAPWIHGVHERRPLFTAPLTLSFGPLLTAGLDPRFAQNEKTALKHANYTNIPLDLAPEFDLHFPKHAYLSLGIPFGKDSGLYFSIGIGENFYGRTRTGSILLSDYMDRVSFGRLSLYSPNIRYGAEIMQLEALKYLYMHYLQLRFFKRVSLSLTEGMMVNAPLELRYLNPLMIFHNLEPWKTYSDYNKDLAGGEAPHESTGASRAGSFFGAKIEYQPIKRLRLYGLFGLSQLQLPIEHELWEEDLSPDALAFQAGAEVSLPAQNGYWRFGAEGVYTYPYMYLKYDKAWSYYKESAEVDNMALRQWTGTPFGPDSIAGTLWFGYDAPRLWSLAFSFVFAAQGALSDPAVFDTEAYRASPEHAGAIRPPTGDPVYTASFSLKGVWSPYPWLNLMLQPGYCLATKPTPSPGKTVHSFELALSIQFLPAKLP